MHPLLGCIQLFLKVTVMKSGKIWITALAVVGIATIVFASAGTGHDKKIEFPRSLDSYHDGDMRSVGKILSRRMAEEPFNLVATLIFICAIIHTFLSSKFLHISHQWKVAHQQKIKAGKAERDSVHIGAGIFHFLGEVEAIFGIWAIALGIAISIFYGN